MANLSKTTRDPEEIRRWAEERGGKPAHVKSTGSGQDIGILRIEFPGFGEREESLEPITWEEFFDKFAERDLVLVFQEETAAGEKSNFNKLIGADTAAESATERGGGTSRSRGRKASTKKSARASRSGESKKTTKKSSKAASRKSTSSKSGRSSRTPAKKVSASRGAAKKTGAAKKSSAKKSTAKKTTSKKSPSKKSASRKRR